MIDIDLLLVETCRSRGLRVGWIVKNRSGVAAMARAKVMQVLRQQHGLSLGQIAKAFDMSRAGVWEAIQK